MAHTHTHIVVLLSKARRSSTHTHLYIRSKHAVTGLFEKRKFKEWDLESDRQIERDIDKDGKDGVRMERKKEREVKQEESEREREISPEQGDITRRRRVSWLGKKAAHCCWKRRTQRKEAIVTACSADSSTDKPHIRGGEEG